MRGAWEDMPEGLPPGRFESCTVGAWVPLPAAQQDGAPILRMEWSDDSGTVVVGRVLTFGALRGRSLVDEAVLNRRLTPHGLVGWQIQLNGIAVPDKSGHMLEIVRERPEK